MLDGLNSDYGEALVVLENSVRYELSKKLNRLGQRDVQHRTMRAEVIRCIASLLTIHQYIDRHEKENT